MKTDGSLGALIQGVSQQPASTRLPGQCDLQENFSSNPVDGLTRRPPLEFISHLFTSTETPTFKDIALGTSSKYISAFFDGDVRAWDLEGTEQTINTPVPADLDYLDGSKLAFATLDYDTYLVNKSKITAMDTGTKTYVDHGSIVSLLGGQYGKTYTVTVTWVDAGVTKSASSSYTTPDGSTSSHILNIASTYIATQLATALAANATNNFNTTFTITRVDDVIWIKWTNGTKTDPFTVTTADGEAGTVLLACNNEVGDIGKLPRYAPQGYYTKIRGEAGSEADDWYVQFVIEKDALGNVPAVGAGFGLAGSWKECVAKDIEYKFNPATMPHVLAYDADADEFTYKAVEWKERRVGDDLTNPLPSFVGKTIYDMAHFQSRLVFTAGNKCIMSRTNKPEDFFVETATAQTDTDPIDIGSSVDGVSQMEKIVPHNRDLVIFAPSAQFIVFGRNTLTPKNSSLVLTTTFEASLDAQPVPAGKNVFFAITYGKYVGVREFYTEGSADINDARPITQHVLKYIPGTAQHMATSSNFDILLLNAEDRTKVFAYEYIWLGEKKVQSSWSRWPMPDDAVYYWFVDSVVYVIMKRNNDYLLCKMDLDMQDDEDVGYQIKLDYRAVTDNVHTSIVPIVTYNANDYVFVQGAGCPHPGMRVLVKSVNVSGDLVELAEDMEGGTVIHGIRYMSRYQPTLPVVKDGDGVKVGTGKLRIGKFLVSCSKTGRMYVKKFSKFAADVLLYFSGRFVANPNTVVGEEVHTDNVFIVPFKDKPENADLEIYTDDYTPLTIETIEWIGQYSKRGRRITTGA